MSKSISSNSNNKLDMLYKSCCPLRNQLMKSSRQTRIEESHQTNRKVQRKREPLYLQHLPCLPLEVLFIYIYISVKNNLYTRNRTLN